MMRAMVFAAGLGTRLKPFTLEHPKALVPVAGTPMLQRVIDKLKGYGITDITVNVHHFADQIVDYIAAKDNFGIDIHISDESDKLLDTGGGIIRAMQYLTADDSPVLVHNADILTDFPLDQMLEWHMSQGNDITLLVAPRQTSRYLLFGQQQTDAGIERVMRGWTNIKTGEVRPVGVYADTLTPLAFGGVHILSQHALAELAKYRQKDEKFSIIDFYVDRCNELRIGGYMPDAPYSWHDIGKPESLAAAEASLKQQ